MEKTKRKRKAGLIIALVLIGVLALAGMAFAQDNDAGSVINGISETNSAINSLKTTSAAYTSAIYSILRTGMIIIAVICLAAAFIRLALVSNAQKREAVKDKIFVILIAVAIGAAAISIVTIAFRVGSGQATSGTTGQTTPTIAAPANNEA